MTTKENYSEIYWKGNNVIVKFKLNGKTLKKVFKSFSAAENWQKKIQKKYALKKKKELYYKN